MQLSRLFVFWVHLFSLFNFTFPSLSLSFLTPSNLTLYGDAFFRNNAICLTQETTCLPPSSPATIGRALFSKPIRFLDPQNHTSAYSFSSRFSFSITPNTLCPFGDGIVFLITSNADSFSPSAGYMGLPRDGLKTQDSYFAVEFDTSFNPAVGDINGNHIGIDVNSVVSVSSVDVVSNRIDLKRRRKIKAWVEYGDSTKSIQIWVSYSSKKPPNPILVAKLDLSQRFEEYMFVGFSASNGQGSALHIVDQWWFKTFSGDQNSVNQMDATEVVYCFKCNDMDSPKFKSRIYGTHKKGLKVANVAVALGWLVVSVVFVIALSAAVFFFVLRKRRVANRRREITGTSVRMNNVPRKLSLEEVKLATMGFSTNKIVGEGASAIVYKGSLPSGGAVAVKRFDHSKGEDYENPFNTEFATMVGCLKHKNLVQLQGWCSEGSELILVYEYLSNGSLDQLLHRHSPDSVKFLSWNLRLNIVLGVASALTYLHDECARQIIHRDVKTCNIMLDDEFNAKLGDFGLAEIYDHNCASREATIPAGTIGYLAPEYVYFGVPTVKTDVYSFGVVALEVATGKRAVAEDGTMLVDWIWDMWAKRRLMEAADTRLSARYIALDMERLLKVGLLCLHPSPEKRPTAKEAAKMIRGEVPLPVLPASRPTVAVRSNLTADCEDILNFGENQSPEDAGWLTPRSHFSRA